MSMDKSWKKRENERGEKRKTTPNQKKGSERKEKKRQEKKEKGGKKNCPGIRSKRATISHIARNMAMGNIPHPGLSRLSLLIFLENSNPRCLQR